MEASKKTMENFESLWFFNNVLNLTTTLNHQHKNKPSLLEEDTVKEENRPSDSEYNILHDVVVGAEILVPRCPNCGEIADVGVEQRAADFAKPERRRRGGRRRRRKRSKRKVVGELDSCFYGNSLDSESSFSEETKGQYYYRKMPPFHDGSAMKEHLKSWAYAVACAVR